jgi:hypothetical protein
LQSMYLVDLLVKWPVHVDWKESQIGGISQLSKYSDIYITCLAWWWWYSLESCLGSFGFIRSFVVNYQWTFSTIRVQYFMPMSKTKIVLETYAGWDTKQSMKWKATSNKPPWWIHTYILIAWKKRSNTSSICIPAIQVKTAKDNLARYEEVNLGRSDFCSN